MRDGVDRRDSASYVGRSRRRITALDQPGADRRLRCVIDSTSARPAREPFDLDLVPEHRTFWNETTIQSFWAGTCETEHPDRSRLFYDLSNILVHFLNERSKSLVDYLRCANH